MVKDSMIYGFEALRPEVFRLSCQKPPILRHPPPNKTHEKKYNIGSEALDHHGVRVLGFADKREALHQNRDPHTPDANAS